MQIQLTLFVPRYIYIWCSDQANRSSELWLWKHQTCLQKMLKFHGTKIIGWSCFAVIFHPSKRPTTLRNQVTDYDCGMKLIGIFTQHLEGVFSWPLKTSFSPQTQFHRIILGTPGNISQLKPCAGSVCAHECMWVSAFSPAGVPFWVISLFLMVIMLLVNICVSVRTCHCG